MSIFMRGQGTAFQPSSECMDQHGSIIVGSGHLRNICARSRQNLLAASFGRSRRESRRFCWMCRLARLFATVVCFVILANVLENFRVKVVTDKDSVLATDL